MASMGPDLHRLTAAGDPVPYVWTGQGIKSLFLILSCSSQRRGAAIVFADMPMWAPHVRGAREGRRGEFDPIAPRLARLPRPSRLV